MASERRALNSRAAEAKVLIAVERGKRLRIVFDGAGWDVIVA